MSLFTFTASDTQIATTNVTINNKVIIDSFLLICYPVMSFRRCKSTIVYAHKQELLV